MREASQLRPAKRKGNWHRPVTHGMSETPIYRQWAAMLSRCVHFNRADFHRYGGRGIKVCKRWQTFEGFYADMGVSWKQGLTLERKNNDKNYTPSNCHWATRKQQAFNTCRTNIIDTPWGPMPLGMAAERTGIHRTTIYSRIKAGKGLFG